jgi:hypothetical protein
VKPVVEAFVDSLPAGSLDLSKPVQSHKFISSLLGYEVDDSKLRSIFNGFHAQCPNFKPGENDCPDCIAKHGFDPGESDHAL